MGNKRIIMVGHKAQAGKDTFFKIVEPLGYTRFALADRLKEVVADLYQFSSEQMYGSLKDVEDLRYSNTIDSKFIKPKRLPRPRPEGFHLEQQDLIIENPEYRPYLTPRRILQIFGQQMRSIYPDIWASYAYNVTANRLLKDNDNLILTDFRFQNEAAFAERWCKDHNVGLIFIKVTRPILINNSSDISENDLNDFSRWHYILANDSDLKTYYDKVHSLVETL